MAKAAIKVAGIDFAAMDVETIDAWTANLSDASFEALTKAVAHEAETREARKAAVLRTELEKVAAAHGVTLESILKPEKPVAKVAPKYMSTDGKTTWSGRGRTPTWVEQYEMQHGEGSRKDLLIPAKA